MKQLDLTEIPTDQVYLGWLTKVVAQMTPKKILITKEQSENVLSSFGGQPWKWYKGVSIKVVEPNIDEELFELQKLVDKMIKVFNRLPIPVRETIVGKITDQIDKDVQTAIKETK